MRYLSKFGEDGETMWVVMPPDAVEDGGVDYAFGIYPMEDYALAEVDRIKAYGGRAVAVPAKVVVRLIEDDEEDIESISTVPPGTSTLVF